MIMKHLLPLLLLLPACASLTTGTFQSFTIETPQLEGAECDLTDKKGGQWHLRATPGSVTVRKGDGPMQIICRKEGYRTTHVSVDEEFAAATMGNIILGGAVGVLVDVATGAAQQYPDMVTVWMEPERFDSPASETSWKQARDAWEEKERLRKAAAAKPQTDSTVP
ncbi:MAG: hypothetical protein H7831_11690 [Magnetococcus sp. WYHC-3]